VTRRFLDLVNAGLPRKRFAVAFWVNKSVFERFFLLFSRLAG